MVQIWSRNTPECGGNEARVVRCVGPAQTQPRWGCLLGDRIGMHASIGEQARTSCRRALCPAWDLFAGTAFMTKVSLGEWADWPGGLSFRAWDFGFLVSGFGLRVSGFRFRVSGFGLRVSGFGFRVSGFGFRGSGFGFRVSGFGFRVSSFRFRVSGFGFRVSGSGFRGSGSGSRVWGVGFRISGSGFLV